MRVSKFNIIKIGLIAGLGGLIYWKLANNRRFVFWYISKAYSPTVARYVEAIYRIETGNYTSNIYKNTKGAGVLAFRKRKPYGHKEKLFKGVFTTGIYTSTNGFNYVKFFTLLDGFNFVANYLTINGLAIEKIRNRAKKFGSQDPNYIYLIEKIL
jgi:hypothetical protein